MTTNTPQAFGMRVGAAMAQNNDASANAPALPSNLLATIAANPQRLGFFIQNQSAVVITVVFVNSTGSNNTILLLEPNASGAGHGGGYIDMGGCPHWGAIKIYGAVGSQVGACDFS